jgi:hypothetical protein
MLSILKFNPYPLFKYFNQQKQYLYILKGRCYTMTTQTTTKQQTRVIKAVPVSLWEQDQVIHKIKTTIENKIDGWEYEHYHDSQGEPSLQIHTKHFGIFVASMITEICDQYNCYWVMHQPKISGYNYRVGVYCYSSE